VNLADFERFVVADIPGIVEGAHLGKGMGLEFLRHIERTILLIFLIDLAKHDWASDYERLKSELNSYDPCLLKKPRILVFNKIDLLDDKPQVKIGEDVSILYISALHKEGLERLIEKIRAMLVDR
jgi:GTP-binding protein